MLNNAIQKATSVTVSHAAPSEDAHKSSHSEKEDVDQHNQVVVVILPE